MAAILCFAPNRKAKPTAFIIERLKRPTAQRSREGAGVTAKVARSSNRGSRPGERRGGRQKGTPNKVTAELKDMILQALDKAGGVDYLFAQSHDNPTAFLTLVGKVLPLQVKGAGDNGEHIVALEWRVKDARN